MAQSSVTAVVTMRPRTAVRLLHECSTVRRISGSVSCGICRVAGSSHSKTPLHERSRGAVSCFNSREPRVVEDIFGSHPCCWVGCAIGEAPLCVVEKQPVLVPSSEFFPVAREAQQTGAFPSPVASQSRSTGQELSYRGDKAFCSLFPLGVHAPLFPCTHEARRSFCSPRKNHSAMGACVWRERECIRFASSPFSENKNVLHLQRNKLAAACAGTSLVAQATRTIWTRAASPAPAFAMVNSLFTAAGGYGDGAGKRTKAGKTAPVAEDLVTAGELTVKAASTGSVELVRGPYVTAVGAWLLGCSGLIFGLVCWGGYTRLTKSGLSMTDWQLEGTRLPSSEEAWETEFRNYKETPEYREVHFGMSIEEFKEIYFVEWFHRMLGRATGVFFVGGLTVFSLLRALSYRMMFRLTCLGALGGTQGLVGWWMVKSGFSEPTTEVKTPRVSPYRLAAHLATAMTLYSLTLWQALSLFSGSRGALKAVPALKGAGRAVTLAALKKLQMRAAAVGALICTTLTSGAFVAGNEAGRAFNTWPKMLDHWVPPEVYEVGQNWQKVFESLAVVQFNHRMLAYASMSASVLLYLASRCQPLPSQVKKALILLPAATTFQLVLGIFTLLTYVPIELGVLHQAGGMTVLTALVYLLQRTAHFRTLI